MMDLRTEDFDRLCWKAADGRLVDTFGSILINCLHTYGKSSVVHIDRGENFTDNYADTTPSNLRSIRRVTVGSSE